MEILYITDVNYIGKFKEDFSFGYRPFMSWIPALDAFHCSYYRLDELDVNSKFDLAIIGSLNSILLSPNKIDLKTLILSKIKKIAKKIIFQQESYHRSFIHDAGLENKSSSIIDNYYTFISHCDAILVHNKIDQQYFGELFNKPCYIHPQFIVPIENNNNVNFNKENNFILSSFDLLKDKGGSIDPYLLVKNFNFPIYSFGSSNNNIPINFIPYDSDYISFNQKLSKFKIGINIPSFPIGGSFPLQCAMMKIPCVGWDNGDPQYDCFPELTASYPNFNALRNIINKLLTDNNFYVETTEKGYRNFIEKYSFEKYNYHINKILSQII